MVPNSNRKKWPGWLIYCMTDNHKRKIINMVQCIISFHYVLWVYFIALMLGWWSDWVWADHSVGWRYELPYGSESSLGNGHCGWKCFEGSVPIFLLVPNQCTQNFLPVFSYPLKLNFAKLMMHSLLLSDHE